MATTPNNNAATQQKLDILKNLVTAYSPERHQAQMLPIGHARYGWHQQFRHLDPAGWATPQNIPYVAATSLLDAYSQLPRRPDLAFNALWSATNNAYNDLYLSGPAGGSDQLTDSRSIKNVADAIAGRLNNVIPLPAVAGGPAQITVFELLKNYTASATDKNLHFVAAYVLRGIAVETHNTTNAGTAAVVRTLLIPSSYKSFKKNFPVLHARIASSTGAKYAQLCNVSEKANRTEIDYGIAGANADKARKLVHATGLIIQQEIQSYVLGSGQPGDVFEADAEWVRFQILALLYASRNAAAHGNAATRLNSVFADGESVSSSSWTFLFCYCYLSLIFLCQGHVSLADLAPIYENSRIALT
ncbi:hypothetical protein CDN99_05240 [Roseateles aquatilis]|uniref:Uncharacterized protein n=2 Tax=Roseateles aquatilis TaxID=431061 RepID=A0A246JMR6_9BURK|nr:hypothetical protein CDN99_05240 [Roseateles aquatilis]